MFPQTQMLHFILLPHLTQGHMIPMINMAKLLAQHGVTVTIITTPLNATRNKPIIDRAIESGLHIQLRQVQFPCTDVGLPEGCETLNALPSKDLYKNLLTGIRMLQKPVEQILAELNPRPSCIISDQYFAWTNQTARVLQIPRPKTHSHRTTEIKPRVKEDEEVAKTIGKEETINVESEKPKIVTVEEAESHKPVVAPKERNIDLQLDLEKTDRDSGTARVSGNNKSHFHRNVQKLQ